MENEEYKENQRRLNNLEEKVDKIMTNHLPHIQVVLTKINSRVGIIMWIGALVGSTLILGLAGALAKLIIK